MEDESIDRVAALLCGSTNIMEPHLKGGFRIPRSIVRIGIKEAIENGRNVLDEYGELVFMTVSASDTGWEGYQYSHAQIDLWRRACQGKSFWNPLALFKPRVIYETDRAVDESAQFWEFRASYAYRRQQANAFIADPKLRKAIFKRDGKVCRKCGSTKRLSIDHVIPVARGGGDELENLQVLCMVCNASKGKR